MARTFNLTAELNLQAPRNISQVVSQIQSQLRPVNLVVNVQVSRNAIASITQLNTQLALLRTNITAINGNNNAFNGIATSIGKVNTAATSSAKALQTQSQAFANTRKTIADAKTEMEAFGFQTALAIRRFAAFGVGTAGILGLVGAIKGGVTEAIHFNKEMVRLSQVTGKSTSELQDVSDEITRLATSLGVSSKELLDVSTTLAQAGLSAKETKIALEALAKSSLAPSFDNMKQTTEGVIAVMHQFKISANDIEAALGSINSVAAAFAVESQDLISSVRIAGGVFSSASQGVATGTEALNQFISVITAVRATTRESAESIATGLRTIFTRVQRPRTIQFLEDFGIKLTDIEGKFVGPYEAAKRLSAGLKDLDTRDLKFTQIGEELGGYRQLNKVIPLIKEFAVAQEALGIAQKGATSLTKDAEIAQESFANQITKVSERFLALIRTVSQSKTFEFLTQFALKTADAFIKLAESIEPILPFLTILAGVKLSSSAFQFGSGFIGGIQRGGGGASKKFARGGLVPGQGNGDTVPAHLTPGEFVVRKDAVKALGTDFLENVNKYAVGGVVPAKFTGPKNLNTSRSKTKTGIDVKIDGDYGGMFFQLSTGKTSGAELFNDFVKGSDIKEPDKAAIAKKIGYDGKIADVYGQPYQFFPSKQRGDEFDNIAKTQLNNSIHAVLGAAGGLPAVAAATKLSPEALVATMEKQIGFENFAGGIWEAYISAIAGQVSDERGRNFDLIAPSPSSLSPIFGPGVNKLAYGDAKFTSSSTNRGSLVSKAARQFLSGGANLSVHPLAGRTTKDIFGEGEARANEILGATGDLSGIRISRSVKAKANGGSVDSVGAMLTPGEFVIRKEAASKLGAATLNKMNHADKIQKFAHGGYVGFSTGGFAPTTKTQDAVIYRELDKLGVTLDDVDEAFKQVITHMKDFGVSAKTASKAVVQKTNYNAALSDIENASGGLSGGIPGTLAQQAFAAGTNPASRRAAFKKLKASPGNIARDYGDIQDESSVTKFSSASFGPLPPTFGQRLISRVSGIGGERLVNGVRGIGQNIKGIGITGALLAAPHIESGAASLAGVFGASKNTASATGSAFSAALSGGAAGAAFGPWGIAIGAATAGVYSFATALKEANVAEAMNKLKDTSTALGAAFDDLEKNIPGAGAQAEERISNSFRDLQNVQLAEDKGRNLGGKQIVTTASGKRVARTDTFRDDYAKLEGSGGYFGSALTLHQSNNIFGHNEKKAQEIQNVINNSETALKKQEIDALKPDAIRSAKFFEAAAKNGNTSVGKFDASGQLTLNKFGKENQEKLAIAAYSTDASAQKAAEQARLIDRNANLINKQGVRGKNIVGEGFVSVEELQKRARVRIGAGVVNAQGDTLVAEQKAKEKADAAVAKAALDAAKGIELLAESFDKMAANIGRVISESDSFNVTTENLANSINGNSTVGRKASQSDIFSNTKAYSGDELKKELAGISGTLGLRKDVGDRLTGTIVGGSELERQLPKYLLSIFSNPENNKTNTDLTKGKEALVPEFLKGIEKNSGIIIPEEVKTALFNKIEEKTNKQTAGDTGSIATYFKDELGNDIAKIKDGAVKAALELRKGLESANSTYLAGINQYIQLQLKANEASANFAGDSASRANRLKELSGKTLTFGDKTSAVDAKLRAIVGLKDNGKALDRGALVGDIGRANKRFRGDIDTLEAQKANLKPEETFKIAGLDKQIGGLKSAVERNNKALEVVSSSVDSLSAIESELAKIQQSKLAGRSAAEEFISATPKERQEIELQYASANALESGQIKAGDLANNKPLADRVLGGLKRKAAQITDPNELNEFNARTSKKLYRAAGFGITAADENSPNALRRNLFNSTQVETPEEKRLREQGAGIVKTQDDAGKEILKMFDGLPKFIQNLDTQLLDITTKIKQSVESAFQIPVAGDGAGGLNGQIVQEFNKGVSSFSTYVTAFTDAANKLAATPTTITHTVAPMTVNVNYNGVAGLDGAMEKIAITAGNEAVRRSLPMDAVINRGQMVRGVS